MSQNPSSPLAGDKLKKAVLELSELLEQYPEKTRNDLLYMVELKFDLSPRECQFLNTHFSEFKKATSP